MSRSMSKSLQLVTVAPKKDYKIAHPNPCIDSWAQLLEGFLFLSVVSLTFKAPSHQIADKKNTSEFAVYNNWIIFSSLTG